MLDVFNTSTNLECVLFESVEVYYVENSKFDEKVSLTCSELIIFITCVVQIRAKVLSNLGHVGTWGV